MRKVCFLWGMTYKEIAVVLKVCVGFDVNERRVYDEDADATAVIDFICSQLQGSGQMHGYLGMHRKCALTLSCGVDILTDDYFVLSGCTRLTDRRMDRQTDIESQHAI